jgi:polyisoprenyl-phosphate glycosyltransferase
MGLMKLSVIVPCFNEEDVVLPTYARLSAVLVTITTDYEIIFVDDGSQDRTAFRLADICNTNPNVRVIRLARNFGHQNAIAAGLASASGDAIVIIDADLQDPPEIIPEFVAKWREGFEVVVGQRLERPQETLFKRVTAHAFYRILNGMSDVPIHLDAGDFRLLDRKVLDALNRMPERYRLLRGMVSWVGFRQAAVPYKRAARFAGTTKYSLSRMFSLALDGLISFSTVPLRLMTLIGLATFTIAMVGIGYAVIARLTTNNWVPGWTLMFIAQLLLGSLNMLGLGLLGEYIGRIYGEAKQRPLYIVAESLNSPISIRGSEHSADPDKPRLVKSSPA